LRRYQTNPRIRSQSHPSVPWSESSLALQAIAVLRFRPLHPHSQERLGCALPWSHVVPLQSGRKRRSEAHNVANLGVARDLSAAPEGAHSGPAVAGDVPQTAGGGFGRRGRFASGLGDAVQCTSLTRRGTGEAAVSCSRSDSARSKRPYPRAASRNEIWLPERAIGPGKPEDGRTFRRLLCSSSPRGRRS
jgi:hypothetical protein